MPCSSRKLNKEFHTAWLNGWLSSTWSNQIVAVLLPSSTCEPVTSGNTNAGDCTSNFFPTRLSSTLSSNSGTANSLEKVGASKSAGTRTGVCSFVSKYLYVPEAVFLSVWLEQPASAITTIELTIASVLFICVPY